MSFISYMRKQAKTLGDRMKSALTAFVSNAVPVPRDPWNSIAVTQSAPPNVTSLTLSQIRNSLANHEGGTFYESAQVASHLGRDADIQQALHQRVLSLQGLPFELKEANDSKAAEMVAKETRALWARMCPRNVLSDMLRWGVTLGFAVAQIVWQWDENHGKHIPTLEPWHPAYTYHDQATGKWWATTTTGLVEIVPGDGRWVLYLPNSKQHSYMYAAVRCLPEWFLTAQMSRRDANRFSEVNGQGVWTPKIPTGWESTEDGKLFMSRIANVGRHPVIALPQGSTPENSVDLDIKQAQSNAWNVFDFLLKISAGKIRLVILGQNMTSDEGSTGSFAKSKVGQNILGAYSAADSETLGDDLQVQFLGPWAHYLRGDKSLAPRPCWITKEPEDLAAKANALKTGGEACSTWDSQLSDTPQQVDKVSLARMFGVPMMPRKTEPNATSTN